MGVALSIKPSCGGKKNCKTRRSPQTWKNAIKLATPKE